MTFTVPAESASGMTDGDDYIIVLHNTVRWNLAGTMRFSVSSNRYPVSDDHRLSLVDMPTGEMTSCDDDTDTNITFTAKVPLRYHEKNTNGGCIIIEGATGSEDKESNISERITVQVSYQPRWSFIVFVSILSIFVVKETMQRIISPCLEMMVNVLLKPLLWQLYLLLLEMANEESENDTDSQQPINRQHKNHDHRHRDDDNPGHNDHCHTENGTDHHKMVVELSSMEPSKSTAHHDEEDPSSFMDVFHHHHDNCNDNDDAHRHHH